MIGDSFKVTKTQEDHNTGRSVKGTSMIGDSFKVTKTQEDYHTGRSVKRSP